MGMLARLPGHLTMSGNPAWLVSGPNLTFSERGAMQPR
jgi:hypothetical protein